MLIDDLQVRQVAGQPDRYGYVVTLREYIEPVEPESADALDAGIRDDAAGLLDGLVDGLDLAVPFATGLEQFVQPLTDLLARLTEANKR